MLYQPEFILYLWLLPVAFMIAIPSALAILRLVISIMKEALAEEEYIMDFEAFAHA